MPVIFPTFQLSFSWGLFGQGDVRETQIPDAETKYWTCAGNNFVPANPDTDQVNYAGDSGTVTADANGIYFAAQVNLPQGATVTGVVVYGNAGATAEIYELERIQLTDPSITVTMGSANIGAADTSITSPIVDNESYTYRIFTTSLDTGDIIYSARITYTI